MILLWGVAQDNPLAEVRQALADLKEPTVFVNQRTVLETEIELRVDASVEGVIHLRWTRLSRSRSRRQGLRL